MKPNKTPKESLKALELQSAPMFVKLCQTIPYENLADFLEYDVLCRKIAVAQALEGYTKGYYECYRDMKEDNERDLA